MTDLVDLGILFDRSRVEDWEKCPRKRFWRYEYKRPGMRTGGVEKFGAIHWDLLVGNAVHMAVESITLHGLPFAAAINGAREKYLDQSLAIINVMEDEAQRAAYMEEYAEKCKLLQAIALSWKYYLPTYQANFEPVEMEKEELLTMTVGSHTITLMARTDIISRRKNDGGLVIHNLKTTKEPNKQWQDKWASDQQTLTELMAVEHRLGHKIDGVIILGLCKGRKSEWPKGSGKWFNDHPLIRCWYKKGEPPATEDEFYAKYEWSCTAPHTMKNGRKCPGGRDHRLSGVYKAQVEEVFQGGIEAWAHALSQTEPDVLRSLIVEVPPLIRSEWEFERWKRMVVPREVEIAHNAGVVQRAPDADQIALLDHYFPMHTGNGNCVYPFRCDFYDVCWGSDNPTDEQRYPARVPNHEQERLVQIEPST